MNKHFITLGSFGPKVKKTNQLSERYFPTERLKAQVPWPYGKPRSIKVAEHAGFCDGVTYAVQQTLKQSTHEKPSYLYGPLVHNEIVVSYMKRLGWKVAQTLEEIPPESKVIIRAHGISPQEKRYLEQQGCEIKDYTCTYVKKIHKIVAAAYQKGEQIIIIGSKEHPEIKGILGECEGKAFVLNTEEDVEEFIKHKKYLDKSSILVAQTTFSVKKFTKFLEILKKEIAKLAIFGTICNATETRQTESIALASEVDLMFVIGSKGSSNTLKLLDTCLSVCGDTHLLELPSDLLCYLEKHSLEGKRIGITAGASSPESIIREVIQIMSEHELQTNEQGTQEQDISFTEFLDSMPELRRGATVKGTIVRYDSEFVYLDIKDKSEGKIPLTEFTDPDFDLDKATSEHQVIEAVVRSVHNSDVSKDILLSKVKAEFAKNKKVVEEAYTNKTPIVVRITSVVKDGVIGTFGGIDIYIHKTQLALQPVENLNDYKGQSLEILITQFDPEHKRKMRVSGSHRVLLSNARKEKAAKLWETLTVGSICEGVVRSLTNFGAFVDLGGVDGLVHVSELAWYRIKHPSEVLSVGDKIQVYIKEIDAEKKRISLGYKKIEDDPYYEIEARYPVGSVVTGKVVRMFHFGAFIEIAPHVDALCHLSQISDVRINKPEEALKIGMEVSALVKEANNEQRRISVSIKDFSPINPPTVEGQESAPVEEELPTEYIDKSDEE